jgi:hypothetical protein
MHASPMMTVLGPDWLREQQRPQALPQHPL